MTTAAQRRAVAELAALDPGVWHDTAGHYTCVEAEALASFIAAFFSKAEAAEFLARHADDDDEGDMHFNLKEA